ncbi:group 1 truncated hemoglobin [Niveibacterium sp. SC-1]|uniref:group I truncated hemoglobin n=1 Tax=Niveibacterium sp. SC-1 TaxID=3135646 RepID=UPI00311E78EB
MKSCEIGRRVPGVGVMLGITAAAVLCLMPAARAAESRTYDALGGEAGVRAIVHALLDESTSDPQTRRSFAKINRPRLEKMLALQICALADGGCVFDGDPMGPTHAGLKITESEFYGMVEHLRAVLDAREVPLAAKNALLARLAPMKRDIVTR